MKTENSIRADLYPAPLNDSQMGVYLDQMNDTESTKYNIPVIRFYETDKVDLDRLVQALRQALLHFETAHIYIGMDGLLPVMLYQDDISLDIPVINSSENDIQQISHDFVCPFHLGQAPLFRSQIVCTEQGIYVMIDYHHMISDGNTIALLSEAIEAAYDGTPLVPEEITLAEQAHSEHDSHVQEKRKKDEKWFIERLDGLDIDSNFPIDRPDTKADMAGKRIETVLEVPFDTIEQTAKRYGVTKGNIFISAFAYALAKVTCQNESMFCTASAGRHDPKLAHTAGMFVRTFPFYAKFDDESTIEDTLKEAHEQMVACVHHDSASFAELAKVLGIRSDIMFTYQGSLFNSLDMMETPDIQANLVFLIFKREKHYDVRVEYRTSYYEESSIRRLMDLFGKIVRGFTMCSTLKEIQLQSEEDRKLIDRFNETETPLPEHETIVSMFRRQAAATPENVAVVYKDEQMSYAELDDFSDRIAVYLHEHGIGRGDFVSTLLSRCIWMPAVNLGVLKCGAAYQPLDPSYPQERLAFMVKDSNAKMVIANRELMQLIPEYSGSVLFTDEIQGLEQKICLEAVTPEDTFILLYTSGTTGTPKGAMLRHKNLVNFCQWYMNAMELDENSRAAAYASFGFDASMMDTYPTLLSGAQLHILPEEIRLDLMALDKYFCDQRITNCFMTTQVGRQFALITECKTLKHMSVGGEKLVPLSPPEWMHFYNAYGPTECTIFSTCFKVSNDSKLLPIGKPLSNTKLYVVDNHLRQLPIGAAGELCISGTLVGAGYLNRPEKTAEVFVHNPFCDDPGYEMMYRTGDIVRYLPDGNIEFIGRRDGQVKVRGFRIELTEVEGVIREFPGIRDATVAAFDATSGGKFIAAYVVSDEEVDIAALNAFIAERKPPYMVPEITMQIDAIPLNQNQKVNRRALPTPKRKVEKIIPPQNEIQKKIFDLVAEIIGHTEFGIDTDIQLAGLTSIGMLQLNVQLSETFGVSFGIRDVLENKTVRALEDLLNHHQEEAFEVRDSYPLTKTQMGIFAECMAHPGSTIYNIPIAYGIDPEIDLDELKKAIVKAIIAHPYVMATLFMNASSEIMLSRNDSMCFDESMIQVIEDEFEAVKDTLVRPYELLKDRLFRIMIIKGSKNYLFIDMHHIISDGSSMNVLLEDISSAYEGLELEKESFSGYEVSLLEEKRLAGQEYTSAREYYNMLLVDADTECVPPRTSREKEEASGFVAVHTEGSANELKEFCKENGISMSTLFNAAFGLTLGKFTYKEDVLYTTIYNGRSDSRMNHMISMLVKTFPVRCEIKGDDKVIDYLNRIGNQMMESMTNDVYSFAEIVHDHNVNADIMFTYQGDLFHIDTLCGKKCEMLLLALDEAKAMMDIDVTIDSDDIIFECNFRSDLFDKNYLRHLVTATCMTAFEFTRKHFIREVSILTENEKNILEKNNKTDYPVPFESVNRMFEHQVRLHPDKNAVIAGGEKLSYQRLNRLANRVANALIKQGVSKDEIIGLIAPRTKEVFIGEMAILKSGAAFLPMVPEYPDDRIEYCLVDAQSRYVITTQAIKEEREKLFKEKPYTVLTFEELLQEENEENPDLTIPSEALCYCIYTSGSTGTPKGVMIEHKNLRNFLDPNEKNPETANFVKYGHTVLSVISVSFDFSLMEVQLPLCNGLTVCMADEDMIHDPIALADLINTQEVDVMACTPSFLGNMIDIPQISKAIRNMKYYDFGAEAFPPKLYEKLKMASPDAIICNGYGPTETTISCVSKVLDGGEAITIGCPAANVKTYVCDQYLNVLPTGACGELVIAGRGVGRGYVKLPEKTKEVFVEINGERAYRSGDLVRILDNSEIEFFGRFDNQVKLRGFRVELDEIENTINTYPEINSSKVVVRNNGSEDYLAGFFTADTHIDISALTAYLKEKLTYYMVPSVLMQLDAMPLTVNGKIDTKKLPNVEFSDTREYVEPKGELEKKICTIFSEILKQDKISATDDFFEIGGTSLTATIIVIRLSEMGHNVVYKDIFDYSTPRELAEFIQGSKKKKGFSDDYDYTVINSLLKKNSLEYVDDFTVGELGNIIITGATGFLGIHILKQYLDTRKGIAYCLIRKGKQRTSIRRIKNMMMYYFGDINEEYTDNRIVCIDGDITNAEQLQQLQKIDADVVINCAALVKHFVSDDSLDKINVGGVENLIDVCIKSGKRLIQISTTSVGGMLTKENRDKKISENELFFGQIIDNDYIRTKFLAERAILEAKAKRELDGMIIRVGNLMSRNSDGEFQINFITNGFMRSLNAFKQLGAFPMTAMHEMAEFSPIDSTAEAILRLACVRGEFSVFHAYNCHSIYMSDVIASMRKYGFHIDILPEEQFGVVMKEASKNPRMSDTVLGLIAYDSGEEEPLYITEAQNRFTAEVLYRMGYLWPITDDRYLYKCINALDGLGFFGIDD